jgi:molybdopterin biosynthesis enzyme
MVIEIAAVALAAQFIKQHVAAVYKATRVAIISSKKELAAQLGKVTNEVRKVVLDGGAEVERTFEVPDEAFITAWRRLSVFAHVLLTS